MDICPCQIARVDCDYHRGPKQYDGAFFTCPTCGSHYFNTSNAVGDDKSKWVGHCKGHSNDYDRGYTGCTFRWCRADDEKLWGRGL